MTRRREADARRAPDWALAGPLYRRIHRLAPLARTLLRVNARGLSHVPLHGPLIVAANHPSMIDPIVLGTTIPRPIFFVAADWLFHPVWRGRLFARLNVIPVHRARGDNEEALARTLHILRAGGYVGIFPEGRLTPLDARSAYRSGVTCLAALADARVLPVGLVTAHVLPPRSRIPRLGERAYIRVGEPLRVGDRGLAEDPAAMARATDIIMQEVYRLRDDARAELESESE